MEFPRPIAAENVESPVSTCDTSLRHLLRDETGQDLIEYSLVAALIGLSAVTAIKGLSTKISTAYNSVGSSLTSAV
jgi:pilus assembly protein Flp/PilA